MDSKQTAVREKAQSHTMPAENLGQQFDDRFRLGCRPNVVFNPNRLWTAIHL